MVRQVTCQVPGCTTGGEVKDGFQVQGPYLTDPDCVSVAEQLAHLDRHIKIVHELCQKQMEAESKKKEVETVRYVAETDRMAKAGQFSGVGATG